MFTILNDLIHRHISEKNTCIVLVKTRLFGLACTYINKLKHKREDSCVTVIHKYITTVINVSRGIS